MINLNTRLKKLEKMQCEKNKVIILRNDLELQNRKYCGLPHEPFISFVNGIKIIHCLAEQDIGRLT